MSRKNRLEKLVDKELYNKCKSMNESSDFTYDRDIAAYIELYEWLSPDKAAE